MISHQELKENSKIRLKDAKILLKNKSYDGALYLCGYAVEIALKAIVCKNLNPTGLSSTSHIPSTKGELKKLESLHNHSLDSLLALIPTHISIGIKSNTKRFTDWSTVLKWNPEMRYAPILGRKIKNESTEVIAASSRILNFFMGANLIV